ncbi:hypothetical protein ACN077_13670 [Clostridium chromiireducens]|uniref:hypothetical protein n=1 Tax=Clostridium chromiireducens TaxID=225345 RepID=UPI003AF4F2EE
MKDIEEISKEIKDIAKGNKKKALAIAVAAAFMVSSPLGFAGCYNPQEKEKDEEDNGYSSGGTSGGWHGFTGGSSGGKSSISDGSSSGKSSISSSGGKSSGYSGSIGGSSSS